MAGEAREREVLSLPALLRSPHRLRASRALRIAIPGESLCRRDRLHRPLHWTRHRGSEGSGPVRLDPDHHHQRSRGDARRARRARPRLLHLPERDQGPLIFRLPGSHASRRIDDPVGIVDIVPTVCAILGIEAPDQVQGTDLSGSFDGGEPLDQERYLYCESLLPTKYGANPFQGVVTDRWKYIRTTRPEMYDLVEDPGEANSLAEQRDDQARLLQDRLEQMLAETVREADSGSGAVLDEAGRRRLESLGYLGGASVSEDPGVRSGQGRPQRPDFLPQAPHQSPRSDRRGEVRGGPGNLREAARGASPRSPGAPLSGEDCHRAGDFSGAVAHLTEAVRLRPDARSHIELGTALIASGKTEEAMKHFEEAIRIEPDAHHEPYFNLGNALAKRARSLKPSGAIPKPCGFTPGLPRRTTTSVSCS